MRKNQVRRLTLYKGSRVLSYDLEPLFLGTFLPFLGAVWDLRFRHDRCPTSRRRRNGDTCFIFLTTEGAGGVLMIRSRRDRT